MQYTYMLYIRCIWYALAHTALHHTTKPPPAIKSAQMFADTNIPLIL